MLYTIHVISNRIPHSQLRACSINGEYTLYFTSKIKVIIDPLKRLCILVFVIVHVHDISYITTIGNNSTPKANNVANKQ